METRADVIKDQLSNGVDNDVNDMPPLEGSDDEEQEELPRVDKEKAESIKDKAKISTKKKQTPSMPLPLKQMREDTRLAEENDNKR